MGFLTMFSWTSMWSLFGLISILTTIWFAGPAIAFAEYKPLESVVSRLIAMAMVCLIFLSIYLFKLYKTKKMNKLVIEEIKASDISEDNQHKNKGKESILKEQFSDIETLLQRQYGKDKRNFIQRKLFSDSGYIYQKPWFLVVGAPGVGKTTAILNSGLSFPIGSTDHVSKLAGTRDCDWFLTDEALLLDTAGRFIQQNDDLNNSNDWNELLGLLKRCRTKQPINGLVLMLSTEDILSGSDDKLKQQLQQIRLRLQEMKTLFNNTFPLYIVVNKIDLISGFNQFFNNLNENELKKVFGVSLDPASETSAEKINLMADGIDGIVEKIQNNIFKSVSYNNQNNDPSDLAIGFSIEFEKFSLSLKTYLKRLLNLSRYDTEISLAGVYFTSAAQESDQNFILDESQNEMMQAKYASSTNSHLTTKPKSYFINEIFELLLIDTANIAGLDNIWIKKQRKIYWIGVSILGGVFFIILFLLIRAYNYNGRYLEALSIQLNLIEDSSKKVNPNEISSVLGFANKIYHLPENNINKELLSRSFFKNIGLSQHPYVEKAAYSKQQSLVDENILPMISNEIDKKLKSSILSKNYKSIYNDLKAYIMLNEKKYYDNKFIFQWVISNVLNNKSYDPETLKALEKLLNARILTPHNNYDKELVQQARELLIYTDVAEIIMLDLKNYTNKLDQRSLSSTSFISMGGVSTNNVFRRVSDRTLNDPVNILFTKYGYQQIFLPFVNKRLVSVYKDEKWVVGNEAQMKSVDEVISDIYSLYAQQYISTWKSYIQDIKMVQPKDLQQAMVIAKQLSEKNSSLAGIIKGISLNTNLLSNVAIPKEGDQQHAVSDVVTDEAKKNLSPTKLDPNVMINELKVQGYLENIANNFSQFQGLTQVSQDSSAQLDEIIKSINDLYVYLVALELSIQSEDQLMPDVRPLVNYRAQVNRLPDPFRPMLDVFVAKITESSQAYKDSQMAELVNQQDQILQANCKKMTIDKYPFNINSDRDISIQELGQIFAKNGSYLTTLESNVSVSQDNKVPFRILLDKGVINRGDIYKEVETINMQLFSGENIPKMDIIMNVRAMDKDIDYLNISYDSKKYQYYHGPIKENLLTWPAKDNHFVIEATAASIRPEKIEVNGDWALFRLLDKSKKLTNTPDGRGVLAIFEMGKKNVYIEFKAVSGKNPFNLSALREFKC